MKIEGKNLIKGTVKVATIIVTVASVLSGLKK